MAIIKKVCMEKKKKVIGFPENSWRLCSHYHLLCRLAQGDGNLAIDGTTGYVLEKVSLTCDRHRYPDWSDKDALCEAGERHRRLQRATVASACLFWRAGRSAPWRCLFPNEFYPCNANTAMDGWLHRWQCLRPKYCNWFKRLWRRVWKKGLGIGDKNSKRTKLKCPDIRCRIAGRKQ